MTRASPAALHEIDHQQPATMIGTNSEVAQAVVVRDVGHFLGQRDEDQSMSEQTTMLSHQIEKPSENQ